MAEYKLLDRTTLYNNLAEEISSAKKYVIIDSYIWVDDYVGRKIAEAVLESANKGAKILIRSDNFGSIFEHTPGRIPLIYDDSYFESFLATFYNNSSGFFTMKNLTRLGFFVYNCKKRPPVKLDGIYKDMKSHKNICIQTRPFFNHGKTIIIDGKIAYVGGQCISKDYEEWIDYNQKIVDESIVKKIALKLTGEDTFTGNDTIQFVNNDSLGKKNEKTIYDFLKDFIASANDDLYIEMVYLGNVFIDPLLEAAKKGVNVHLIIPKKADTNQARNMLVLTKLLKEKNSRLKIYFYEDGMLHTKGMLTSKKMTLGSTNFHGANGYPHSIDEHNIYSEDKGIVEPLFQRFLEDLKKGREITSKEQLPEWSRARAYLEVFSVFLANYVVRLSKATVLKARKESKDKIRELLT